MNFDLRLKNPSLEVQTLIRHKPYLRSYNCGFLDQCAVIVYKIMSFSYTSNNSTSHGGLGVCKSGLPLFRKFAENHILALAESSARVNFLHGRIHENPRSNPIELPWLVQDSAVAILPGMSRLPRFRARAQLSEIPRSSLSPCPQSALVAET